MKKTMFVVFATIALAACAPDYSEGSRAGVVTKFSHKGLFVKSWEGSLNQGGVKTQSESDGGTSVVPNAMTFNVPDDPILIKQVQDAMVSGRRVELQYRQWALPPLTIENDYVVVAVRDTN